MGAYCRTVLIYTNPRLVLRSSVVSLFAQPASDVSSTNWIPSGSVDPVVVFVARHNSFDISSCPKAKKIKGFLNTSSRWPRRRRSLAERGTNSSRRTRVSRTKNLHSHVPSPMYDTRSGGKDCKARAFFGYCCALNMSRCLVLGANQQYLDVDQAIDAGSPHDRLQYTALFTCGCHSLQNG